MTEPVFLELLDVLEIHNQLVDLYGGQPGLRDTGLLQSALAMPLSGSGGSYFHADLYEMAAAYLLHLIKNHPFIDANKRTALAWHFIVRPGFPRVRFGHLYCNIESLLW